VATQTKRSVKAAPSGRRPKRVARKAFRAVRAAKTPRAAAASQAPRGGMSVLGLREGLHVGRRFFSRLTGFSERAIADWEKSKPLSGPSMLKMREIERLRVALSGIMREEFIGTWLDTPNPAFEGLKPVEVIERGEIDRIWRMVYEVGSGQPT
jgi:DNA-binding transcriptional regulator YiaG